MGFKREMLLRIRNRDKLGKKNGDGQRGGVGESPQKAAQPGPDSIEGFWIKTFKSPV